MTNYFTELAKINVSEHVEKKGKFSYLSWTFAINELRKKHEDATWKVQRFDGKPFMQTELGYFVEVSVTVNGIELSQIHPVLNNRNMPIEKPTPFNINTSIQRCLVKAIALHGLGLYIYAGEDLPTEYEPITSKQLGLIKMKSLELGKALETTEHLIYRSLYKKFGFNSINELSKENAELVTKELDLQLKNAKKKAGDQANVSKDKSESQAESTKAEQQK